MDAVPPLDTTLLRRYDCMGPRYTSYPAAPYFKSSFGEAQFREYAARSNAATAPRPLSLYVHIPYCFSPCFYCACNRVITRDPAKGARYLERLQREIEQVAPLFDRAREVVQLHLGGGTPNFLRPAQLAELVGTLDRHFYLSNRAERDFSIEIDPRAADCADIERLASVGFNRVSVGVQDFNLDVQRAVNRIQSVELTLDLIDSCRDSGVRSVNVDLIYGLPRQTPAGFRRTLRTVISARPDRVAVYGYAHLPDLFKAQRRIDSSTLPGPEVRMDLLRLAIEELSGNGYRYIGMDHFALPDDDLVRAQQAGELQRNFMGYTTHANCDLIGVGVSAISRVGHSFSQNFRELKAWEAAVDNARLPLWRGLALSPDDCVRGAVIDQLMCQGFIETAAIEQRYSVEFGAYFSDAIERLQPHVADNLVLIERGRIAATPAGRLLLRSIAMCFDGYLSRPRIASEVPSFSKVV